MPPKLTQPLRPVARYRKGQAPAGLAESDSDSDQEQPSQGEQPDEGFDQEEQEGVDEFTSTASTRKGQEGKKIGVKLGNVKVDQQGTVQLPRASGEESSEYGE